MANRQDNPTTKFKVDISELKAGISEASRQIKLANSEFKAASSGMDDWQNSTEGLAAKLKQLGQVEDAEKKKLELLKQQYALVAAEQGENSKGAQDLQIKINNQTAAVNKVSNQIKDYDGKLNELKASANQAGNAADSMGDDLHDAATAAGNAEVAADKLDGGFTVLKGTIANLAAQGISKAVDGFKNLAFEGGDAMSKLQASTGLSTKESDKFNKSLLNLYKGNYGESLDDLAEKMGKVKQNFNGLSAKGVEEITKKAITLQDTFGMDFDETIRGVQNLMQHFGIDADTAFDLFAKGAQNGLNKSDELGDNVAEYSGNFKQAGYSAEEYFQLLENGTKGGAYNLDKVNDSINEVKNRLGDGTIEKNLSSFSGGTQEAFKNWQSGKGTMKDVINSIVGDISNCTNEQDALNMAAVAFGTMGEDANLEVVKSLTTTGNAYKNVKGAMEKTDKVRWDNTLSQLKSLGRTMQVDVLMPLADKLMPAVEKIISFVSKHMPAVLTLLGGIATAFAVTKTVQGIQSIITTIKAMKVAIIALRDAEILSAAAAKIAAAAQWILNIAMSANPIGLIVIAIAALVTAFVILWKKSDKFREFWINLWEAIKKTVEPLVEFFKSLFTSAVDAIKGAWSGIKSFFSGIWNGIKSVFSAVGSWFKNTFLLGYQGATILWNAAKSFFSSIWNGIKSVFSAVGSWFKNIFSGAWSGIKNVFKSVGSFFSTVVAAVKKPFSSIADWFKNIFTKAWDNVKKVFSTGGKIFSGIKEGIAKTFKTIVNGIIRGINTVIAVPFKAINGALDILKKFSIAGKHPFSFLPTINAPQIPLLAKGGVVDKATLAMIGENGKEAVVPLSKNAEWISGLADQIRAKIGVNGVNGADGNNNVTYNFNQVNNSPKALSRLEIYKQTKNQMRLLRNV